MAEKANAIQISPRDNVAVAMREIKAGEAVLGVAGVALSAAEDIRKNHKVALRAIAAGERIVKYGESIGAASKAISPGEWVHTHNLKGEEN